MMRRVKLDNKPYVPETIQIVLDFQMIKEAIEYNPMYLTKYTEDAYNFDVHITLVETEKIFNKMMEYI